MNSIFQDVKKFGEVAESPTFAKQPEKTLQLCYDLVQEEVVMEFLPDLIAYSNSRSLEHLTKAVDGAIDGIYVLAFFLTQMGIDGDKMWKLVQDANMAKFPGGKAVKHPVTGKVQKPEGWKPPDDSIFSELIEWNSQQREEEYVGGMNRQLPGKDTSGVEATNQWN